MRVPFLMLDMKNILFTVALCIALCSCDLSHRYYNPDIRRDKDVRTTSDTLQLSEMQSLSADVYKLLCIDRYLILAQRDKDALFRVLDTSTEKELAVFGQLGHALNEFGNFPFFEGQIYCLRDEKGLPLLFVKDGACTKVIDLRRSVATKKCVVKSVIKGQNRSVFHSTFYLPGQKRFIYKRVSYDDPRDNLFYPPEFCLIDDEEKIWDVYPDIVKPKDFPQSADADYDQMLIVSTDGLHVASVNSNIDITTIFDLSKKQSLGIVNPDSYTYEFLEKEITESNAHEKIRLYNVSACAASEIFVILENGKTLDEINRDEDSGRENKGMKLCGYDWDGNCQFAYCIDKNISNIAYDDSHHKMYAIEAADGKLYAGMLK